MEPRPIAAPKAIAARLAPQTRWRF